MTLWIRKFFPDSIQRWKNYAKITIPVILATFFISINNFVDNFMVSQISGGITAVGMANVWTGIIFSFIVSTNMVGSIIFSQYWGKKEFNLARQVNNIRYILCFFVVFIFAILAWIIPENMLKMVENQNRFTNEDINTFNEAKNYLFIIAFSWILFAYIVTSSGILRETGAMKISLFFTFLTLITNVGLNLILIPQMGVSGSAIATVASRILTSFLLYFYKFFYKKRIRLVFLKIFQIEKRIWKQFFKRFLGMSLTIISSIIIATRAILWSQSLPSGSLGASESGNFYRFWGIGYLTIAGITNTIANILFTTFASVQISVSIVVGQNLGQNKIEEAKKNAAMLKGFLLVVSIFISILTLIAVFIITKTNLIIKGIEDQVAKGLDSYFDKNNLLVDPKLVEQQQILAAKFYLNQIFLTSMIIILINPIWVQINVSLNIIKSGGRANFAGFWDFLFSIFQLSWQAITIFIFLPLISDVSQKLLITFLIFYSSDIIKWIVFEILYLKTNWAINLTTENSKEKII